MRIEREMIFGLSGIAFSIALMSAVVLATVYASQYWGGLSPCPLCLYQRSPWWIALGLGLFALWAVPRQALCRFAIGACGVVLLAGGVLAVYHVGVEQHWWRGPTSCAAASTPASLEELKAQIMATTVAFCDQIPWSMLGISMAGYNAISSFVVGVASLFVVWPLQRSGN